MEPTLSKKIKAFQTLKSYRRKLLITVMHAVVLTIATLFIQNLSILLPEEMAFFKFFNLFRKDVFNDDKKPLLDSIIFLDISKDLALTDDVSADGYPGMNGMEGAKTLITDRKKLAVLFAALKKNEGNYRYALCDIAFEDPSLDDSILKSQIAHLHHAIFPANLIGETPTPLVFDIPHGVVTYLVNEESFVKLPLFYNDSVQSLPVMMTEDLTNKRFERRYHWTFENGRPCFNALLTEFYYRPADLRRYDSNGRANLYYLGELVSIPDFFDHYLKNKYIVIGNFSTDMHKTYLGTIPGSLILLDTYLTLRENKMAIPFTWVLILLLFYLIISYKIFIYPEIKFKNVQEKIKIKFLRGFLKKYVSYVGLFILLNMVSYFFFRNFVSLLLIGTYLTLLEEIRAKWTTFRESKNLWTFLKEELI